MDYMYIDYRSKVVLLKTLFAPRFGFDPVAAPDQRLLCRLGSYVRGRALAGELKESSLDCKANFRKLSNNTTLSVVSNTLPECPEFFKECSVATPTMRYRSNLEISEGRLDFPN